MIFIALFIICFLAFVLWCCMVSDIAFKAFAIVLLILVLVETRKKRRL